MGFRDLDEGVVERCWPPQRVVAGMRTSKWLRMVLVKGAQRMCLKAQNRKSTLSSIHVRAEDVARDLMRLEQGCYVSVDICAASCAFLDTLLHGLVKTNLIGWQGAISSIDLAQNTLGDRRRAAWLPESLRSCNRLTRLNLRENAISDDRIGSFASILSKQTELVWLSLSENTISDEGAKELASALACLPRLVHFDIGNNEIGDEGLKVVARGLQSCTKLRVLKLGFNEFEADGVHSLAKIGTSLLTDLDVSGNSLEEGGAIALCPLLSRCTTLAHLDLGMCDIGAAGASAVAHALHGNSNLRSLELFHNKLDNETLLDLSRCSNALPSLQRLDVSHNACGLHGAVGLTTALRQCEALQDLNASSNRLTAAGATELAHTLSSCHRLSVLDLSENMLGDTGGAVIASACAACVSVTDLNLSDNAVGDRTAMALAAALQGHCLLRRVRAAGNEITGTGADALARVLGGCLSLTVLDLRNGGIDEEAQRRLLAAAHQRLYVSMGGQGPHE